MQEQKNKERGITLIALVVTIIVLIILASVSINMLVGENGLITMAQRAKNETEQVQKEEEQELAGIFGKNYADYNGELHIEGEKVLNQYNEQIQLNGLYYGYGNSEYTEALLTALKNKGVNMIKIGYSYSGGTEPYNKEGNMEAMYSFIDQLLAMNFYIDIIYWSGNDLNQEGYTKVNEATDYFTQIANKYPDNTQILYEICNEPFDNTWGEVKQYADSVIPEIRQISENAIISVPTNDNLFNETFLSDLLNYNNIMYVTHIYAEGTIAVKSMTAAIANNSIPVFISEWSNNNGNETSYNNEVTDNLIYIINKYKLANSAWYFYGSSTRDSEFFMIKKEYWEEVLKTGNINDNVLGIAGKYYFDFIQGFNKGKEEGNLVNANYINSLMFWEEKYRTNITKIIFEDKINVPDNALMVWDVSDNNSGTIIAYLIDDGKNNGTYELYICGNNEKVKVVSLSLTFRDFTKLEYIDITQMDTRKVKSMYNMFGNNQNLQTIIGLENIDTSNVTNMQEMFYACAQLTKLDVSNFNTSNVINMSSMFNGAGMRNSNFELILGEKFDTSKVTNMTYMFYLTGIANPNFILDLRSFTFKDDVDVTNIFTFMKATTIVYVKDEEMQQFVINARGENAWSTANVLIK